MRTFIAIEIPDEIKQALTETQRRLKDAGVDAGWPQPEGIHLTLKFLGEVPETQIPDVVNGLREAAQGISPFRLEVRGAGTFPSPKNARVVWVGLTGDVDTLSRLQAAVEDAMVRIGMERDDRAFTPHLTLGRIKYIRSRDRWLKAVEDIKDVNLAGFNVTAISLMKSELKRTGAVYTEMGRVELK